MTRRTTVILVAAFLFLACGPLSSYLLARHAQCVSGNDFRRLDRARWEYVISLTEDAPRSPHDQLVRDRFVAYVRAADAQRHCWI